MIVHNVQQGSGDWLKLRLGVPTASEFHRIVTPAKCELSKQARPYAFRLAAERLLGRPMQSDVTTAWMERGTELEDDAVKLFEFQEGVKVATVGFVTTDDGRIGASPDRLVGDDGLLEVKCCGAHIHLQHLIDGFGADYRVQVQGQLLVTEREWCTRLGYHPEMPLIVDKQYRDEPFIAKLREALDAFLEELDKITERARSLGVIEAAREVLTPEELADRERGPVTPHLQTIINPWAWGDRDTTMMAG